MSNASFLPEDYLDQRAERRTNLISLTLFAIVMVAVFAAFLVTNSKWSQVKDAQRAINAEYAEAADQIRRLTELEKQRTQMMEKAELAMALVERVPRSILLAGLINRMPQGLGLLTLDLKSDRVRATVQNPRPTPQMSGRRRGRGRPAVVEEPPVEIPKFKVRVSLVGMAPTDEEVSRYIAQLNDYPLLEKVQLQYTEERTINDRRVRQFEVHFELNPDMDVREDTRAINPHGAADAGSAAESTAIAMVRGG